MKGGQGAERRRERRQRCASALALFACWLALPAWAAPARAAATGALSGGVELVPRHGLRLAQGGDYYGASAAHGAKLLDYRQPGFAVVYVVGPASPGGRAVVEYSANGFVPEHAAVGAGGVVRLRNGDSRPHTFSAPSAELFRRLEPREEVEIHDLQVGPLALFALDDGREMTLFVSPGPYCEVDADGRWSLAELPPGPAVVRVWHPRLPGEERQVTIRSGETERIHLQIGVDTLGESSQPEWQRRIRVSGVASFGRYGGGEYYGGAGEDGEGGALELNDARYFVSLDLAHGLWVGESKILRSAAFLYERELYRLERRIDHSGDAYLDLRGLLDSDWLNLQLGRFQLPVGEYYLRFGTGWRSNDFAATAPGAPWFPDEGLKLWGASPDTGRGYVVSLTDGGAQRWGRLDFGRQISLRLFADPLPWLHVSASALRCGKLGSAAEPASSSIWFGESWVQPLGTHTRIPNFHHGGEIADAPPVVNRIGVFAGDVVFTLPRELRLWLGAGDIAIEQPGSLYDRGLRYWIAEAQIGGAALSPRLGTLRLAARLGGYGTFDGDEGYLLDSSYRKSLGYNMQSLTVAAVAVSWRAGPSVELRSSLARTWIGLVRGVPAAVREEAEEAEATKAWSFEARVHF